MAEKTPPPPVAVPLAKPILQKPPGYRVPTPNGAARAAAPLPPHQNTRLPPALRYPTKRHARQRRDGGCCRRLCCWIFLLVLAALLALAIVGGIAYLWFQPRLPSFRIDSFKVTHFNVSSGPGGSALSAAVEVAVHVANPSGRIAVSYADLEAMVSVADADGEVDLGAGTASGFVQPKKNSTVVKFLVSGKGIAVSDAAASRLRSGFRSKAVRFGVDVRTKVGLRIGGKNTGHLPIRVLCGEVGMKRAASGDASPSSKCKINLLRL